MDTECVSMSRAHCYELYVHYLIIYFQLIIYLLYTKLYVI